MKKLLIITLTIFFFKFAEAQETKVSMNFSVGVPYYGIKSLNHEMSGSYSILFHDQVVGIWFTGVGFVYNTAFKYKPDTIARIRNMHVAELKFGFNIPDSWNQYVAGPAIMFNIGVGFKADGNAYPNAPLEFAIALQQNFNVPVEFLDNLHVGLFARGTLGTFLYKDLDIEPAKNLRNNYFGTVEGGLRISIVDSQKKGRRR